MPYILYLSLRWLYEVGSCAIAIRGMTAIKWYLFCYRLDFNQKSLNHTVANAESTVPNAQSTVPNAQSTGAECTVNCALDIVNRMMSSILYLSLRWYYEVGSCTIVISVMTAIKWYLFCYRLDFSQKSLNHTVANAQSTVHWTLLREWRLASYISVYDGRMKLGVAPLRSLWWQWYLFCYRLDFDQKLLNYTTANAQSTVHWTLLREWRLASYISVYDGRMKLGVAPLRSVWWQLLNDIYFVID